MTEPDDAAQAHTPGGDAAQNSAQQIAAALAKLRGLRPGGPPRREGGFGRFDGGPRPLHGDQRLDGNGRAWRASDGDERGGRASDGHAHDGHGSDGHGRDGHVHYGREHDDRGDRERGPRRRDHGPMGRFAARIRLLEALGAASTPLSVSELADSIGVDQPRASRLVQAAVEAGHVRREADASDARRTNIVLTDEGRAVTLQARGARIGAVEQALSDFSDDDRARLATLLTRLAEAWPRA